MKKETKKEFGKLIYDFAKIGGAITLITPFAQDRQVSIGALVSVILAVAIRHIHHKPRSK